MEGNYPIWLHGKQDPTEKGSRMEFPAPESSAQGFSAITVLRWFRRSTYMGEIFLSKEELCSATQHVGTAVAENKAGWPCTPHLSPLSIPFHWGHQNFDLTHE